jgi:hypothetical protein
MLALTEPDAQDSDVFARALPAAEVEPRITSCTCGIIRLMKLKNFDISDAIELHSGTLFWDIHNFAKFEGLELIPARNSVVMKWTVPERANPWGCYENKFSGMMLFFEDLRYLKVTPRDPNMPLTEDTCVSAILKVDPEIQHDEPYMRTRPVWGIDDSFRLVFQFQSRRALEIESNSVELTPLSQS